MIALNKLHIEASKPATFEQNLLVEQANTGRSYWTVLMYQKDLEVIFRKGGYLEFAIFQFLLEPFRQEYAKR